MPPYVPLPSWLNNADVRYFWKKNDGVKIPPARTKLEGPPSECLMQVNGMSLENLKAWQDELKSLGLSPMWSGEKTAGTISCIKSETENSMLYGRMAELM